MRRSGYFATVVGARPPVAGALRPPRRVFAFERGFVRAPEPAAAAVDPEGLHPEPEAVAEAERGLFAEPHEVLESEPPPTAAPRTPSARAAVHAAKREPVRPSARTGLQAPGLERADSEPRAADSRSRRAVESGPVRELPVADAMVRPPADSPSADVRHATPTAEQALHRERVPQLHIGAIDVTVVPPAAPEPKAKQAESPRSRRPLGPTRPAPWFGLAQR